MEIEKKVTSFDLNTCHGERDGSECGYCKLANGSKTIGLRCDKVWP